MIIITIPALESNTGTSKNKARPYKVVMGIMAYGTAPLILAILASLHSQQYMFIIEYVYSIVLPSVFSTSIMQYFFASYS